MKSMHRWYGVGLIVLFSIATTTRVASEEATGGAGRVPNERTAIEIALRVWTPIYGEKDIASEKPYRATLKNGIWTVRGTSPEGAIGGTAHAEISARDGKVLKYWHEQ
jgi:hypothetical protein